MIPWTLNLNKLNLVLPPTPKPQGSYVPAIRCGSWVLVSGQLPMRDGSMPYVGRVGDAVSVEQAQEAARLCFLNAIAAACSVGLAPEQIRRVLKLTGYVQCTEDFHQQPKVLNGASDLAQALFGEAGVHARAAVGVYALPLNAPVEIEAWFEIET